ncbi:MAG TPA: hypothetical protein VLA66_11505, partial [Thermoanaerobaculia bacterium]|nr:hypothetical protein [Thermoanaerobaculia bacterium]
MPQRLPRAAVASAVLLLVGTCLLTAPAMGYEPRAEPDPAQQAQSTADPGPEPSRPPEAEPNAAVDPALLKLIHDQWKAMPFESLDQVPPCENK